MIARAPYLFLLLIIVPDLYFDWHFWRHKLYNTRRLIAWLPSIILILVTIKLTYETRFIPENPTLLYIYILMLGIITVPKWMYMLCSISGLLVSKLVRLIQGKRCQGHKSKNYGNLIGLMTIIVIWYIVLYGSFVGFDKIEVNHQTFYHPDIPKAFDGYRIVLFSDAHIGTYTGTRKHILQRAIDTINAQQADMIVFSGDLQNIAPEEILENQHLLSTIKAKDGVYSVLGNHDYDKYMHPTDNMPVQQCKKTICLEKSLGWHLLLNENQTIKRRGQKITIAGMENDGDGKRFPQFGDIKRTLHGAHTFIVMLEHDPSSWRRKIVPDGRAQLTLSGHTHDMQLRIAGWSPMDMLKKEWHGWYTQGKQSLFVTAGIGGLIPFRFGASGEIVVIELRRRNFQPPS